MQLPFALRLAVESVFETPSLKELKEAQKKLTSHYKTAKTPSRVMQDPLLQKVYLISRLPATYAVIHKVFSAILKRAPSLCIERILDIGAGPATAGWAACSVFPQLKELICVERSRSICALARQMSVFSDHPALQNAIWKEQRAEEIGALQADLCIFSYSLGEFSDPLPFLEKFSTNFQGLLVLIEPGTPQGFSLLRKARDLFVKKGFFVLAPCCHENPCPMKDPQWCHFAARVERGKWHRLVKEGQLGFEDEKFSYLVLSRRTVSSPQGCLVEAPQRQKGLVVLPLCEKSGFLERRVVSRKDPELYKRARKVDWGDFWPS